MTTRRILAALAAGLLLAPAGARAAAYDALYVFGDSLSDRGNLAETGYIQMLAGQPVTANYPNPPSNHDSFTNGPVALSLVANRLGLAADPSLWVTGFHDIHNLFGGLAYTPGTNYAVAGATSALQAVGGPSNINLPQQLSAYAAASGGVADPNALYAVLIGGNDVRNAALQGTGATAIPTGVGTEVSAVASLVAAGARNLLVINVSDVGLIPEFTQDHPTLDASAHTLSAAYNTQLKVGLLSLVLPTGTALFQFDLASFNDAVLANAAALGFTNTTDRCYVATPLSATTNAACGTNAENIGQFIYWDSIHPTGRVQALWAEGALATLAGDPNPSPVPEPATLLLLAAGLGAMATSRGNRNGRA